MEEIKNIILELENESEFNIKKVNNLTELLKEKIIGVNLINWLEEETIKKNSNAQNLLGYIYDEGLGIDKNKDKAYEYYKSSADQGNICAQHNLGHSYENGDVTNIDYEESIKWYKLAADKGNIKSPYR